MARTTIDSQLTARRRSRVRFELATDNDDAEIRRLLRENPMPGQIALSPEREPDYFADANLFGGEKQTIIAREAGRIVCMGNCAVQSRMINGQPRRVGYLGGLRLDGNSAGRFDIVRRGYEFFRELQADTPADFYFTSIAADNARARNFLERDLPGMPAYRFLADFVTLLVPVPRNLRNLKRFSERATKTKTLDGLNCISGSKEYVVELISCLNKFAKQTQLAAFWTESDLHSLKKLGLSLADFHLILEDDKIIACAALWDQRCFKQIVIRGYSRKISLAGPWVNLAAKLFGTSRLPPVNSALAFALLSPLAAPADKPQLLLALVESALAVAAERGLEFLTLGFAAGDARLEMMRNHFRCREYHTRLYRVLWSDMNPTEVVFDDQPFLPEVSLL
ncbi:MAG TPA: hypothetical protein VGI03_01455 [Verrucomicrobiae bacterium]|jgi:hypothetical protein